MKGLWLGNRRQYKHIPQVKWPKAVTVLIPSVTHNNTICYLTQRGDATPENTVKLLCLLQTPMCGDQQETNKNALIVLVSSVYRQKGREKY